METILTDAQFFELASQLVGGFKGASVLAGVLLGVKILAAALSWRLSELAGIWRLTIISGLNVVGSVLGLVLTGMPFFGALTNAGVLALLSVFVNQAWKQWQKREDDKRQVAPPVR